MKKVEYSSTTRARMKKTLPVSPFFTSRVISALASSTSARTRCETWVVASLTSSPIEASADTGWASARGIEVTVLGTGLR